LKNLRATNDREKRKNLEGKDWKVTSLTEFLKLTPEEEKLIELRLSISNQNFQRTERES
jgi:hypothetical protein